MVRAGSNCVFDWNNYMREVRVNSVANLEQSKVGGEGMLVEIDDSLFMRRKNNVGRILPQQWIFGGICRDTNDCFIVQVPNRSATTLLAAIVENIAEGSIIYSDSWRGYETTDLEKTAFQHFKANHRYNFVDADTEVRTQNIERFSGSAKWRNKCHRGTAQHHLETYLAEFMRRSKPPTGIDPFDAIAAFMPPEK